MDSIDKVEEEEEEGEDKTYYISAENEPDLTYENYQTYLQPEEYYAPDLEPIHVKSTQPKWKKVPRSPSDFSETKSTISSCKDSDYAAWLENYYRELYLSKKGKTFVEKETNTSDLVLDQPEEFVKSFFTEYKRTPWYFSTKYWRPNDVRRHWPLRKSKYEYWLFPSIHPHLNLRSRYGRFNSMLNSAAAVPETNYRTRLCCMYRKVLANMESTDTQVIKILNCDSLCNLKWFDFLTKSCVIKSLVRILRNQTCLEKVYFENTDLISIEGVIFLCALSRNKGDGIKELHMWKMFRHGHCPILISELPEKYKNSHESKHVQQYTTMHYLQILYNFSNLTHLSINYAYLANQKGNALLHLKCIRAGCLKELRLLCLKTERPFLTNPGYGVGGWSITDGVWRRVAELCPEMRVKFVFADMAQYENIVLFLSKSIPVSHIYISSGYDFHFDVPWDLDSTLLELKNWYADTLETLSLHLWHHRDFLDYVLKNKFLIEFPNLVTFEFIGVLENIETLESFCCQLSTGTYKLKTLLFWVEENYSNKKNRKATRQRIPEICEKYRRRFQVLEIDADIRTYPL